ncbi:MAG: Gfo/Idh/MocA family oxidoreductase [Cyclobacteriaceae bacterium]|nr:Gfo/Idh/MocA family oxidoreductase [Cyclobacteriaceae bacterium]
MKNTTRRHFIKTSGAAALGTSLAMNIVIPGTSYAMNSDTLKVGLIGAGGRGTGAANQALHADKNVVLTHLTDIFEDRVEQSISNLKKEFGDRVKVDKSTSFTGFDGAQKIMESDVDVVILTTPPCYRPKHLEMAINAGKHVFCEKPMAVDAPGVRRIIEAAKKAKEKNLSLMSGFCWRYHTPKRATFQKVLDGAIGDVQTVYNTYNTGALWLRDVQPEWSDMKKKLRNWLYYNYLSGDHIVEQAIHSIDMMSWAFGDAKPVSATGTGGRQSRIQPEYGNIFDHFAIVYEYEKGVKGFHFSRQQKDCSNSYAVDIMGSKGRCLVDCIRDRHTITGAENWRYQGEDNDMYQQEHDELFAAIRSGKPVNDGDRMAQSTMLGIMARMVAYTGQTITYDEALNSQEILAPDDINDSTVLQDPPVAQPGITKFI